MYFLEQIKNQFTMQLASYNEGVEAPAEVEAPT
jgi:hypothetical protein